MCRVALGCNRSMILGPRAGMWHGFSLACTHSMGSWSTGSWNAVSRQVGKEALLEKSLWCALTADVWEPVERYHTTHCQGAVLVPCELWMSGRSGMVSEASLGVCVSVLLATTVSLYKFKPMHFYLLNSSHIQTSFHIHCCHISPSYCGFLPGSLVCLLASILDMEQSIF